MTAFSFKIGRDMHYREDEVVSAVRAVIDPETQHVKGVVLIDLKLRVLGRAASNR